MNGSFGSFHFSLRLLMKYGGTNELAVYGVIATVTSLFQALYCGVGQAIQPLVSANCGAGNTVRIRSFWKMSLGTVIVLGVFFTAIGELLPVLSTYYLQSTMHDKMSMLIALLRSVIISGILIFVLPLFLDIGGVWLAMPISELVVAIFALCYIRKEAAL